MKRTTLLVFFSFILISFLGGCSLPFFNQERTNPAEMTATYEAMVIEAMKTAIGEVTQQAMANPSATSTNPPLPPTDTPEPSPTPIPPTETATRIPPTETPLPSTNTPTVTATRTDFNCQLVSSAPSFNQVYPPGGDFDGRWTFKNTGSELWDKEKVDFLFIKGTEFQVNVKKIDLPVTVNKGESIELIVDMLAPRSAGTFSATWGLKKDDIVFCLSVIQIIVK
ncbi:MAG: NBR1-Ig-like domain-containing protein [Anaerolineaceae bacterium]|nr:NBR1-Ig-like domain-containing protein [Anaerolineaceae bacterium]